MPFDTFLVPRLAPISSSSFFPASFNIPSPRSCFGSGSNVAAASFGAFSVSLKKLLQREVLRKEFVITILQHCSLTHFLTSTCTHTHTRTHSHAHPLTIPLHWLTTTQARFVGTRFHPRERRNRIHSMHLRLIISMQTFIFFLRLRRFFLICSWTSLAANLKLDDGSLQVGSFGRLRLFQNEKCLFLFLSLARVKLPLLLLLLLLCCCRCWCSHYCCCCSRCGHWVEFYCRIRII